MTLDLHDHARARKVPVCLYPAGGPLVLFSPSYGGACNGYAYLARAWARQGLAVAVVEHAGSNHEALARLKSEVGRDFAARIEGLVEHDHQEFRHRLEDLRFARVQLQALHPELAGAPVGLAGHSYGSATVAALAAQQGCEGLLLMSPPFPGSLSDEALLSLQAPTLMLTGTRDHSLTATRTYEQRLEIFPRLRARPRYLAVFEEAEHLTFAGLGMRLERWLPSIARLTRRFWMSCLGGREDLTPEDLDAISRWEAA